MRFLFKLNFPDIEVEREITEESGVRFSYWQECWRKTLFFIDHIVHPLSLIDSTVMALVVLSFSYFVYEEKSQKIPRNF